MFYIHTFIIFNIYINNIAINLNVQKCLFFKYSIFNEYNN